MLVWCSFYEMLCCFMPDITGHTLSKRSNICLISPQNIYPQVLGIIKIYFGKCETSLCVVFGHKCLLLWISPLDAVYSSLFLIVESWTLTLIEASEAFSSLDAVLGSSMTSWMTHHCALGVILAGRPLLERFTAVPSVLHLWMMALTVIRWSPKALEMAL